MSMTARGGRHARNREPLDVRSGLLVGVIGAVQFGFAWLATSSVAMTVAVVAGVSALVTSVLWPSLLLVSVFPGSFVIERVGPAAVDLSVADALTALGVLAALPSVPWRAKAFRWVLFAALAYTGVIAVAALANPTPAAFTEVAHRFVMVVGAVSIGAAVIRRGRTTAALRLLLVAACLVAVAAILDTLGNELQPAYPFDMQKNAAGSLLVSTLLCVYFGWRHLRLPVWLSVVGGTVVLGGLAATQSRGAGLALGVVFLIFMIRSVWRREGRRVWQLLPLVLTLGVAVGFAMVSSFQRESQEHTGANYKFGSVGTRTANYESVWQDVIVPNPVFGAGQKWFTEPDVGVGEPHNVILHELSSDGFVGLAALIGLLWACLRVAGRAPPPFGDLAWYVLIARVTADLFDIFWVAGPNTLPFLVLGLAVGAASLQEERAQFEVAPVGTAAVPL